MLTNHTDCLLCILNKLVSTIRKPISYTWPFLSGLYKDDIAQVDYVDVAQNEVLLKLLPRIDYTRMRGALKVSTVSILLIFFILSFFLKAEFKKWLRVEYTKIY